MSSSSQPPKTRGVKARTEASVSVQPGSRLLLGLLGGGTVIYALSVVAALIPTVELDMASPLDGVLRSGTLGLSVVLVSYSAVLTAAVLDAASWREAAMAAASPVMMVVAMTGAVAVAALVAYRYDPTDTTSWQVTWDTVRALIQGRLNSEIAAHPLAIRTDLAAAWTASVLLQLTVVFALLVWLLQRLPILLAALAGACVIVGWIYRVEMNATDGWFAATLSTLAHADAFACGVLAVVAARWLCVTPSTAAALAAGAVLVLGGTLLAPDFIGVGENIDILTGIAALVTGLAVVGLRAGDGDPRWSLARICGSAEARHIGAAAVPALVWVPWATDLVSRHSEGQSPWIMAGLGLMVSIVLCAGSLAAFRKFTRLSEEIAAADEDVAS